MTSSIPKNETLTVEFKSDRKRLSDIELVEAVVCLANADGGDLWLGVEDDGTPTGLHPEHQMLTGLAGMVAARTSPSVSVTLSSVEAGGVTVSVVPAVLTCWTCPPSRWWPQPWLTLTHWNGSACAKR